MEKLIICSVIVLHINLVLPMSDILPLPKAVKKVILPEALADEPPPPPSWRIVEVHDGTSPALAIDSLGKSHLVFGQDAGDAGSPTHIFYGYQGGSRWSINEVTPTIGKPTACAETSVVLDANNNVHIVYALKWGQRVSYVTNESGDWQETILRAPWTGNYESFSMDDNGNLHILFWNNNTWTPPPYQQQINYLYNSGSSWQAVEGIGSLNVKRYADVYCPTALTVTHGDLIPHLIAGEASGGLLHCYKNGTSWSHETFGAGYEIIFDANSTLQVDSSNNLYCVIQNASGTRSLYLAKKISGYWSYELIAQLVAGSAVRASLVIDPNDNMHIAYFNGQKVYYGKKTGGVWTLQEVATISTGFTPGDIGLALNSSGLPRIAYSITSVTSKKIYYADWDIHLPNQPPVVPLIPDKTVNENELLQFSVAVTDDPEDILTYSLVAIPGKNYPDGAVINSATGVFEWMPTYQQAGYYEVNAKVSDDKGGETLALIKITVSNVNTTPTVKISTSSFCVTSGTDFTLGINANDEDGDILTYELKENDDVIQSGTIIHGAQLPDITRNITEIGLYEYTITVNDPNSESATDSCSVEVIAPDENPDKSFPISGDFNGDGMTDVGTFNTGTGSWKVAVSDKGEFNNLHEWMGDFKGKDEDHAFSMTGDFNGDGRADIVMYDRKGGDWKFALSDGEKFVHDSDPVWNLTGFGGGACNPLIGDFNGDGTTDIGYADAEIGNEGFFCIRLAKEGRTGFVNTAIPYSTGLTNGATYAGDFNGDGLTDILALDRSSGKWNVLLSQDTTSTQSVDLIRDEHTTLTQTGGNLDYNGKQRDGDFWTSYMAYSYVPAHGTSVTLTSTSTFEGPMHLNKIIFKQGGRYGGSLVGGKNGYVKLYYNSGGSEVISTTTDDMCTLDGDWSNVTRIEMYMYAYGDGGSGSPADAQADQYELQAWGFAEPAIAAGSLPTFTAKSEWLSGFGAGQEPILTDYNHDGKTDIGYFANGQWNYALSNGTGFISAGDTTGINIGSHQDVCDGDFDTYCGYFKSANGSRSITTTTTFEWEPTSISRVKFRCRAAASVAEGGSASAGYTIYLKLNGEWTSINSGADSGIKEIMGPWENCGGIEIVSSASAYHPNVRECQIETYHYEVQAFETLSGGEEINKAVGKNWPSPFGESDGSGDTVLPSGGDFNGDSIGDGAVFHRGRQGVLNKWEITLHNSKQPDLLVAVDNGIGGTTSIEYEVSTQLNNTGSDGKPALPFPVQVVKKETKSDGMGNSYSVNYEYSGGMFEPNSREFRGFKHVKVIDAEGTVKETEFYQGDMLKGKPAIEEVIDITGKIYSTATYEWQENNKAHGGKSDFPYIISQTSTIYNPTTGTGRDIKTLYSIPDSYGNVTRIDELGFIDDPTDDRYTAVEYEYNTASYIVGKPKHTTIVKDGTKAAETWYRYDTFGSLKEEEKWLNTGEGNPITRFKYDYEANANNHSGNLIEVEDAMGRKTTTNYDASYQYTFPISVTNVLIHARTFTYDKKTGQILTSTDPNGQTTQTVYDNFGRALEVRGPNNAADIPDIKYNYDLYYRTTSGNPNNPPAKITTETKIDGAEKSTAYAFIDGLGRTIEVKTEAEEAGKQLISGVVKYDPRGQVKEKYLPYFAAASPDYLAPNYAQLKIIYIYDPIGRVIQTIRPDNISSFVQYDGWITTATDENSHKITQEKDAFGRLIKVTEYNDAETYLTQYQYDALGNLTKTIDSKNNATSITYDSLGRKCAMNDPDMGHWEYGYDAIGNLIWQEDAKGQILGFKYDLISRLEIKGRVNSHGEVPTSGVAYTYDVVSPQNPYAKGRLTKVTDLSGMAEFFYDNLGREIKSIKTVDAVSYIVERTYDSIDRLKTVKYPDGETLTYTYNKTGGVETVSSPVKTYVTDIDYNENGQMAKVEYGNGTHTDYTYNPETLRLENLLTEVPSGNIQNLTYAFDNVGNVLSITDASNGSPKGTNTQSFQYDDLNRLTKAIGASYGVINYSYDSIGNMTKNADITLMEYGGTAGPHAMTHYTKNSTRYAITYDANGNMLSKETETGTKSFKYDIENRLIEAPSQGSYISNYTINLNAGWNFVSLPVVVIEDIATILTYSGITKAQVSRYNSDTKTWENFAYEQGKDLTEYNDFTAFDYGKGYEIYVDTASTLKVSGIMPTSQQTLDLKAGWNLICAPTSTSIGASTALSGITYSNICKRQGDTYVPVTQLEGGKSYFLKVATNQTWNIPSEGAKTTFVYDGDGGRVKVIVSDKTTTYIGSSYEIEANGAVTKTSKHIFLGQTRICTVENDGTTTKYRYYHQDHIGSSNVITDETGAIAKLIEYSPYGLTSREEGAYNTNYKFTGKLFDTSTALYYYGARYYDPELGRFIQPDTIVPYPDDPQSFNRYSYCRNNPITYIDPTGHSWWDSFKKWIGNIVGAIVGAVVGVATGNFWLGFQAYSFTSSIVNAGVTGNWGGLAGGIVGGLVGGALGWQAGVAGGALLSDAVPKFVVGATVGAIEFGASGFGSGFGEAIGSGASFKDAVTSGLVIGGVSAIAGSIIEGSYMAGWQSLMHGATQGDILRAKGVQRQAGLYRGYSDIATDNELHEGIEITDNYGEYSGKWEFDVYPNTPWTKLQAASGQFVSGTWKIRAESFKFGSSKFITDNLTAVKTAYNDIQSQLGKMKVYNISGVPSNCRTEANRVIERALRVIQK